jgi:hypothetical protein
MREALPGGCMVDDKTTTTAQRTLNTNELIPCHVGINETETVPKI